MIETRPLEVNDFSGGVADFSINAPANTAKKMDNLIVQKNKSLKLREGFSDSKIAVSGNVSELINFNDKELVISDQGSTNLPPGPNILSFSDVNDFDIWNDQIFATKVNDGAAQTPVKSFIDSDSGERRLFLANIPSPELFLNRAKNSDPRSYLVGIGYERVYKVGNLTYVDQGPIQTFRITREENKPVGPENSLMIYFSDTKAEDQTMPINLLNTDAQIGVSYLSSALGGNYQLAIFRTLDGDTTLRRIDTLTDQALTGFRGTKIYKNNISDEDLETVTNFAYTTGGVPNNDPPPKTKYITIANNRAYYANYTREETRVVPNPNYRPLSGDPVVLEEKIIVEEKTIVRQSQTNDPDSVPGSFNVDVKEEITGMSSVREVPIVFCKNQVVRLEGFFDEFGRGAIRPIVIDENAGCVSHKSIVKVNNVLYWCGNDGIYRTDGYKVQKIAKHLDDTYQKDLAYMDGAPIGSAYDANRERVYFAFGESKEEGDFTTYYAKIWVLNLNFPVSENSSFQHIKFPFSKRVTSRKFKLDGTPIGPQNKEILLSMFQGDLHHYVEVDFSHAELVAIDRIIARHRDLDFSDYNYILSDQELTTTSRVYVSIAPKTRPIIYNYEGFSTNFGTNKFKKWIPRMDVSVDLETNLDLQPSTVLDNTGIKREVQPIRQGGDFTWGDPSFRWGDPSFKWRGIKKTVVQTRRMRGDKLRASYLSANFTNAEKVVLSSDIIGARCLVNNYTLSSVQQDVLSLGNRGGPLTVLEVSLLENQTFTKSQTENAFITIGEIANQNVRPSRYEGLVKDKTLPLIKAPIFSAKFVGGYQDVSFDYSKIWVLKKDFNFPGVIPDEGIPYVFSIRKIPEGQRLTLLDYTIHHAPISMSNNTFQTGQNAGVKP